jgi:TPR repeat protein
MLLRRGHDLLQTGDIAAARLALRRAANAGNAEAALTLGKTYDPVFLKEMGVLGFAPDAEKARIWYQRATEYGSSEAPQQIDRLSQAQ